MRQFLPSQFLREVPRYTGGTHLTPIKTADIQMTSMVSAPPSVSLLHSLLTGFGQGSSEDQWTTPLVLSCLAGASTCLGAAVVFLHPRDATTNQRTVGEGTMSFSLALAASVMITVSVISIGPECLQDPATHDRPSDDVQWMSVWSWVFVQRLLSFGLGCVLYFALSFFAFPEPNEIILSEAKMMASPSDQSDPQKQQQRQRASLPLLDNTTTPSSTFLHDLDVSRHADPSSSSNNNNNSKAYLRRSKGSSLNTAALAGSDKIRPGVDDLESNTTSPSSSDVLAAKQQQQQQKLLSAQHSASDIQSSTHSNTTTSTDISYHKSDDNKTTPTTTTTFSSLFSRWSSGADLETHTQRRAWRVAMLLFVSLLCHNFPEGLAVAASALESDTLGIAVTIGIMIHNIPEGIAIAVPCLAARPDQPWLAFLLASASGLAEPLGALVAVLFLRNVKSSTTTTTQWLSMENVLAFVAGIMIMVALYELFPEANRHTTSTTTGESKKGPMVVGTVSGIVIMVATELALP